MYAFSSFFLSMPNLLSANLTHNYMKLRQHDMLINYFPKVERLDLSYNNLSTDDQPFYLLTNSQNMKSINFAGNKIDIFNLSLNNVPSLRNLNISYNHIYKFSIQTLFDLKNMNKPGSLDVDFRGNNLSCGCHSEELSTMELIKDGSKYGINFLDSNRYTCFKDNSYTLLFHVDVVKHKRMCRYPHLEFILSTTLSNALLIITLIIALLGYKYRYRLLTSYLRLKEKLQRNRKPDKTFKYDAFISYCMDDRFWVHDVLMKTLGDKYGFRLCIYLRDFLIGEAIVDEIQRGIRKSKAVIVILSENSLKSNYCKYELEVAYHQSIVSQKKLLVVKMGDIENTEDMSESVRALLSSKIYISWPEEEEEASSMYKFLLFQLLYILLYYFTILNINSLKLRCIFTCTFKFFTCTFKFLHLY